MNKRKFIEGLINETNLHSNQFDGTYTFTANEIIEKIALGDFDE